MEINLYQSFHIYFAQGLLFCQAEENTHTSLHSLDKETFSPINTIKLDGMYKKLLLFLIHE